MAHLRHPFRVRYFHPLTGSDAAIALPGGSGTLEELLEAITLKRLGIYLQPIVLVNILGFFDPLLALFERCIREHFMDERHAAMWQAVDRPEDVLAAMQSQTPWTARARVRHAAARKATCLEFKLIARIPTCG